MSDARAEVAARLALMAMRAQVRQIRKAAPRPFGFAPTDTRPVLGTIGDVWGSGTIRGALAGRLGLRPAIWTMIMKYGPEAGLAADCVEIISDLHEDPRDTRAVEDALASAVDLDVGGDRSGGRMPIELDLGEVSTGTIEITVQGNRRAVPILHLRDYCGFQFRSDGVLATVVARNLTSQLPEFVRLTDLEPFLQAMEQVDRGELAAWFAALAGTLRTPTERSPAD